MLESPHVGFAHLSYIDFLPPLRVPLEALPIRRAYSSDFLERLTPQRQQALIAARSPPGKKNWPRSLHRGRTYDADVY